MKPTWDSCGFTCKHFGRKCIHCLLLRLHSHEIWCCGGIPILLQDCCIFAAVFFKDASDQNCCRRPRWLKVRLAQLFDCHSLNHPVAANQVFQWLNTNVNTVKHTTWCHRIGPVMFTTRDPLTTQPRWLLSQPWIQSNDAGYASHVHPYLDAGF